MNLFDRRWKECVRQARGAGDPRPLGAAPDGGRLLRRARQGGRGSESLAVEEEAWWRWYGVRGLAVATLVLAGCLLFAVRGPREVPSLRPGVEDAVAEVLWSL